MKSSNGPFQDDRPGKVGVTIINRVLVTPLLLLAAFSIGGFWGVATGIVYLMCGGARLNGRLLERRLLAEVRPQDLPNETSVRRGANGGFHTRTSGIKSDLVIDLQPGEYTRG